MNSLKKILELLTPAERNRAGVLLGMILIMATLDMLGVASIMPFMAVLSNPSLIETNVLLNTAYTKLGFTEPRQFLFLLGITVLLLLVFSLAFKALTTYAQMRFTLMREYSIGKRLVEGYLHQPYSWFLNRHSADLGKTVLSEVKEVVEKGLNPIMTLMAQGAVTIALLTLLILIDPRLALIICLTLGLAYALIFSASRGYLARTGAERLQANQARFTAVSEAFGAFKEVKVSGLEREYTKRFSEPARAYARRQADAQVISQLPRFALEAIAFGGLLVVMLYLIGDSNSIGGVLPVIGIYAFAGYRLMPALQQIYVAVTQLRFSGPAIAALNADLMGLDCASLAGSRGAISINQEIKLSKVKYTYPTSRRPALDGVNITIKAKSTVGLVGVTGGGKTTVLDIILGLLEPQAGILSVDGEAITPENRRAWQQSIGYVPQQIYLADDSVAANIAFGLNAKDVDKQAVERAARIANLHNFIMTDLPQQYETTVGERGVRLSGGQRQRIGIARALYNQPEILILDEATSALDNLTEQEVMDAVHNLGHKITIIMVAHRLRTVEACDMIYVLDKGEVRAKGTFEELNKENEYFRTMALGKH